jgi:IS5 family transposase
VLARWVENPYLQHFTGETFFQHQAPIPPHLSAAGAVALARRAWSGC